MLPPHPMPVMFPSQRKTFRVNSPFFGGDVSRNSQGTVCFDEWCCRRPGCGRSARDELRPIIQCANVPKEWANAATQFSLFARATHICTTTSLA